MTRFRLSRRIAPYVFIAPPIIVLGCFSVLPILFSIFISFTHWEAIRGLESLEFVGLDNYAWVLIDDDWFGHALGGTLWGTLVTGLVVHLTAIPLAAFIDRSFGRWRSLIAAAYFMPFITAGIVIWFVMSGLFSAQPGGVVNSLFNALGNWELLGFKPLSLFFPTEPVDWWGHHGEILGVFSGWWYALGWNTLLYMTALQYVPRELYEAARMDGANAWQELRYVTVPQLRPMIFFATSLSVIGGLQGGGPYGVSGYMYKMAYGGEGDFGAVSAMAVILIPIIAAMIWVLWAYVGGRPSLPGNAQDRVPTWPERQLARLLGAIWRRLRRLLEAPPPDDPGHLRGFSGMRAIACLMVICHHLAQRIDGDWGLFWLVKPLWTLALRADSGVSLFFVLSGALLSMPFWRSFLGGESAPGLGQYIVRRAARIVPGYWLALVVAYFVGLQLMPEAEHALGRFLAGMGFVSALHYISFFPNDFNPVLWSISMEVICYVLLPLLVLPAWRLLPGREPKRTARYLAFVLLGLQIAHLLILHFFMTDEEGKGWIHGQIGGAKEWLPYWSPASFMTQFMLGSCAAFGIAWYGRDHGKRDRDFDRMAGWALAGAVAVMFLFHRMGQPATLTAQPYVTPIFPALLAVALFAMHYGHTVHRVLDNRLFNFIATISFGLYLWHWPVMETIRLLWEPDFKFMGIRDFGHWLRLSAIVVSVATLLASVSWYCVERPVLRWAQARLRAARGRARALAGAGS